jgi:hypothetical protein
MSEKVADLDAMLADRADEGLADVTIEPWGTFRVRGLKRGEVLAMQKATGTDPAKIERVMIARAVVSPLMSEAQVARWQEIAPAGELQPLTETIEVLSGIADREVARRIQQFREG